MVFSTSKIRFGQEDPMSHSCGFLQIVESRWLVSIAVSVSQNIYAHGGCLHHGVLDCRSTCVDLSASGNKAELPPAWAPVVLEVGHLGHGNYYAVACGECGDLVDMMANV